MVIEHLKTILREKCFVCGVETSFQIANNATLFREAICINCGASKRNSDVAHAISRTFTGNEEVSLSDSLETFKDIHIYEAAARGKIHDLFKKFPYYVCSEFLEDVPPGSIENGIRCEDLTQLTFPDNSFDLVVTQDVLEHVSNPTKAFYEIKRILKPGGCHIFTVPLHEGRKTIKRALLDKDNIVNVKPPVYHSDPLHKEGTLVYTDFGDDIVIELNSMGMQADTVTFSKWYPAEDITSIDNDGIYKSYLEVSKNEDLRSFFKYNSSVIISKKKEIVFTGERYIPWMEEGDIHYEHLHRYRFAKEFVKSKKVLDLASGEGYGSNILAEDAESVVGMDIDEASIKHAISKYKKENIRFIRGSIIEIPIKGEQIYDVIVCFEALEHIEEHDKLLKGVKRLLKDDGIFIVSTPNKFIYSDQHNYQNPFHLKELYFDEFKDLLSGNFKNVFLYGQKVYPSSNIFAIYEGSATSRDFVIGKGDEEFQFLTQGKKVAKYLIAIASDSNLTSNELIGNSFLVDISETLFRLKDEQIRQKDEQIRQKDEQIKQRDEQIKFLLGSWSWRITVPLRWLHAKVINKIRKIFFLSLMFPTAIFVFMFWIILLIVMIVPSGKEKH